MTGRQLPHRGCQGKNCWIIQITDLLIRSHFTSSFGNVCGVALEYDEPRADFSAAWAAVRSDKLLEVAWGICCGLRSLTEFSGLAGPGYFSLAAGKCRQGRHPIGLWVQNVLSFLSDRSTIFMAAVPAFPLVVLCFFEAVSGHGSRWKLAVKLT